MPETQYLLIRRIPTGKIASSGPFTSRGHAAVAAARTLTGAGVASAAKARAFAEALGLLDVGQVHSYEQEGGKSYDFRVLVADFTVNGVAITPGLRVLDYDRKWGAVEAPQFMDDGMMTPGGEYFDGWYRVHRDGEARAYKKFNGERLTTREPS